MGVSVSVTIRRTPCADAVAAHPIIYRSTRAHSVDTPASAYAGTTGVRRRSGGRLQELVGCVTSRRSIGGSSMASGRVEYLDRRSLPRNSKRRLPKLNKQAQP